VWVRIANSYPEYRYNLLRNAVQWRWPTHMAWNGVDPTRVGFRPVREMFLLVRSALRYWRTM